MVEESDNFAEITNQPLLHLPLARGELFQLDSKIPTFEGGVVAFKIPKTA